MIDFARSHFTWDGLPHRPDPFFRYPGGFVGAPGDAYQVRIGYDAVCMIRGDRDMPPLEIFLLQPCLAEYTIADRNLFQVPSQEFRVALSRTHGIPIAARPSTECEPTAPSPHAGRFAGTHFTTQVVPDAQPARDVAALIRAVRAQRILNARTTYRDEARGLTVTLEFPIRTINVEPTKRLFQVDAGPLALPDLETWDGAMVSRVFLAHAAFSDWTHTEFILRREVEPLATEDWWWEVRGRDRRALHDPPRAPGDPPALLPRRPPTLYNETLAMPARIEILIAPDG